MVLTNYNCTQSELYTTCRQIWLLCQQYLPQFADYKSLYTVAWITENLTLINVAETMPDHEARKNPVKDSRQSLKIEKGEGTDFFKMLQGYILKAYEKDETAQKAMLTEAGQTYFGNLKESSWSEVDGLFTAMVSFVKKHKDVLMAKGYMPASFITRLETTQTSFVTAHATWETDDKATAPASEVKITANNDIKNRAMEALSDGQRALIKDKINAKKFVWNTVLEQNRSPKVSGIGGTLTDKATKGPLSNVTVFLPALNLTAVTDKDGKYNFAPVAAGIYRLEFKLDGFQTVVVEEKEVKNNVMGRLNIEMVAVTNTP